MAVADVDVVDGERVEVYRLDYGLQLLIVAHGVGHQGAQLAWIVGIDGLVPEACFEGILKGKPDLFCHHVIGVVGLLDGPVQQLACVDERNQRGDEKHQSRNSQNEFGLETHGSADRVLAGAAVLLEFVVQGLEADAQDFSSAGLVLARGLKGVQD